MEKMNHLKRVMAWVMTAAMLVSSCPTTAIADEVVSQVQKPVAQTLRSGETYGSLQEAYEAEFETTDETHMSFENRVRDVEKNGKDTLIYSEPASGAERDAVEDGRGRPLYIEHDLPARHEPGRIQGV